MAHPSITTEPSNRIAFIDVWRFLAVVMVIQAHILVFSGVEIAPLTPYLLPLDRLSELGVLIFFLISGFVICSGLIKEQQTTGSVCLKAFYLRRGLRIMPPLWFYLLCILALHHVGITNTSGKQAFISALFLCNLPIEGECSWFAGHTWTLAYEEQFYLLFPFIFIGMLSVQHAKPLGAMIVGLTIASLSARLNDYPFLADYCLYFLFLLSGCLAALLTQGDVKRIPRLPLAHWLAIIAILLFCISYFSVDAEKYIKTLLYPPLIGIMVLCTPVHHKRLAAFFSHAALCYLGRISYTVYLWQELATAYYPNPSLAATLSYIALVFVWASVSFHYFEKPLLKMGSALSRRLQHQHFNKLRPLYPKKSVERVKRKASS